MKLLADESVDKPVVDALRTGGFDVLAIQETMPGVEDTFVLNLANEEEKSC